MPPTHPPPSRLLACMSACLTAALRSRRRCCASCTPRRLEKRCDLREPSPKPQPLSLPPLPRCPVAAAAGGGHVVEIQKYFLIRAQVSGKVIPGSNGRRKDFFSGRERSEDEEEVGIWASLHGSCSSSSSSIGAREGCASGSAAPWQGSHPPSAPSTGGTARM